MSGKQSRQRRKDAVNRARADVYANKGSPYRNNPFTDERQARLYEKYYNQFVDHYHNMESTFKEMAEAYGWCLHHETCE